MPFRADVGVRFGYILGCCGTRPFSKPAKDGQGTRALQHLGHNNIQDTGCYTDLSPERFKSFWRDERTVRLLAAFDFGPSGYVTDLKRLMSGSPLRK
jgi:hypothetical protein